MEIVSLFLILETNSDHLANVALVRESSIILVG